MIEGLKIAVWICIGAIAYNYAGYPMVLFLLATASQAKSDLRFLMRRQSRRIEADAHFQPSVAIIISAFNEESVIEERVKNALSVDYPPHLVEIVIGLDSPTDSTSQILSGIESARLRVFDFKVRRGKLAVICDLADRTQADILVFTDANTNFKCDCVVNLARHFADGRVGIVSGEEVRTVGAGTDPAAEDLYWRYECAIKILESRLHCLHSANGGVYAIRRELFHPPVNLIVEDFQIPLSLRYQGYWIVYDPEAIAFEEIAPTFESQFERRVRLGAGNFQTLFGHPEYMNPLKGLSSFAYWSHRLLRWMAPFLMILAFVCSAILLFRPLYLALFVAQALFYGVAILGYERKRNGKRTGIFSAPLYFCSMNVAMLFGFVRYLSGRQSTAWTATPRRAS